MMKSMAHAWLRHEVEGLEERLENSGCRNGINHQINGRIGNSESNFNSNGYVYLLELKLPLTKCTIIHSCFSFCSTKSRINGTGLNANGGGIINGMNGSTFSINWSSLGPFVVVDSSALSTRLSAVRAIAVQKKSILIVPTCGE